MLRNLWFQLHWLLGITAGIVLAVVGVTGGLLSFEDDILKLMNGGVMTVNPAQQPRLAPDALLARVAEAAPDRQIIGLGLSAEPTDAATVTFAGTGPNARRGETVYLDPYTGELLGKPRGREFFLDVMRLHRWLLAGDVGKQIVGASTIALIVLCLSGLYLRWPRKLFDWRTWLTFSFAHKGRSFLWGMHSIVGTWVLLLYLLASVTGLYWSYEWYRSGLYALAGVEQPTGRRPGAGGPAGGGQGDRQAVSVDAAWLAFEQAVPGYGSANLQIPRSADTPVTIRYLDRDAPHERANNVIGIGPAGEVVNHQRYLGKPLNERLMSSILPLHSGSYFGLPGLVLMMLASLAMPLFTVTGWMLYLDRRRKKRAKKAAAREAGAMLPATQAGPPVLVAYASQSGTAERLAWLGASALAASGFAPAVRALGRIGPDELGRFEHALFVVSTFGDGEAPDNARGFLRHMRNAQLPLGKLRYGLLSLGDRAYERYCGFGRSVDAWLRERGASHWFEPIEVDGGSGAALAAWRQRLAAITGAAVADWQEPAHTGWRLVARRCLNPSGVALPTYHVELEAQDSRDAQWQAGDIAELAVPAGDEMVLREYSIGSVPQDGRIHLLIRQTRRGDGQLGVGSGWLTADLTEGDAVSLRIRRSTGFHGPADGQPMILIGNGTGIAGLRAHLREREAAGHHRNWLIFGERQAEHDFYYRDEINAWLRDGHLQRLDLAFSRDQSENIYVQDRLQAAADELAAWLAGGAVIYVCGSADTMAPAVDRTLRDLLGDDAVERLHAEERYRRDVY